MGKDPVRAATVGDDLAGGGELSEPVGELVEWDTDGAGNVAVGVLLSGADVEDDDEADGSQGEQVVPVHFLDCVSGPVVVVRSQVGDAGGVRTVTVAVPVRVDYQLTPLGQTLMPVLRTLQKWADEHIDEVRTARNEYDARPSLS